MAQAVAKRDEVVTATRSPRRGQALSAAGRGLALFFGLFTAANLLAGLHGPGLDMNLWWIDVRSLGAGTFLSRLLLVIGAAALLGHGLGVWRGRLRGVAAWVTALLVLVALLNALQYYRLLASRRLHAGPAVPFSLLVMGALVLVLFSFRGAGERRLGWPARLLLGGVLLIGLAGFPAAQIWCFGTTDYRRPADAIVVFGARAYADGRPSLALADRVRTACALYQEGLAPLLVFSGGPGDGALHETDVMRRLAVAQGVPERAIVLDRGGLSTHDTVRNTTRLFPTLHVRRVLAVSHFYHLPRIKMSYNRAGWEVFTVPVEHPRQPPREFPFMLLRETAAVWAYYLKGG